MASIKYPRKQDGTCVVCEDIRYEVSGKFVLIGVYGGRTINFRKPISEGSPGKIRLAFCLWFENLRGKFEVNAGVINENNDSLNSIDFGSVEIEDKYTFTITTPPHLFQFENVGIYRFVIHLNDRVFEFPIYITNEEAIS